MGIVAGWFEGTDGVRVPWAVVIGAALAFACAIAGHSVAALVAATLGVAGLGAAALSPHDALRAGPRVNVDVVLMRAVDIGLAFPFLLLVMAIGAALDRTTPVTVIVVLGLTGWLGTARVVRAKTMQVRALEFVVAARALGRSTAGILWRHVLPNVSGLLVVVATISVAQMILAESVLGYLGVGIAPPQPTWGRMVIEGQDYLVAGPWMVFVAGRGDRRRGRGVPSARRGAARCARPSRVSRALVVAAATLLGLGGLPRAARRPAAGGPPGRRRRRGAEACFTSRRRSAT